MWGLNSLYLYLSDFTTKVTVSQSLLWSNWHLTGAVTALNCVCCPERKTFNLYQPRQTQVKLAIAYLQKMSQAVDMKSDNRIPFMHNSSVL